MNNQPAFIEKEISSRVLTLGEYFEDSTHGGIASVLRYYKPCFETFNFIPTYRDSSSWSKLRYDLLSLVRLWWRLLTDKQISVVHVHSAWGGSFIKHAYYIRLAKAMGRKVVLHCHGSSFNGWYDKLPARKRALADGAFRSADKVIALAKSWRELFVSIGVAPSAIEVLNNITPRSGATLREREPGEPVRLLFLGEIGTRKGVFDILEALRLMPEEERKSIRLDIGGNKNEEALKARIAEYGLQDTVCFHGFVSGEAKRKLLEGSDIFILPSFNEGLPIAILEAMSYGCAIISTPVGGIPEVVQDNGKLVEPGNAAQIAAAIKDLSSPSVFRPMGEKSLAMVEDYYPEAVIAHLRSIYQSLL